MELIEIKNKLETLVKEHYEQFSELNKKTEVFLSSIEVHEKEILALRETAKQERAAASTSIKISDEKMKKANEIEHSNNLEKKRLENLSAELETLKEELKKKDLSLTEKEKVISADRTIINDQMSDNKKQAEYLEMQERRIKFAQKELDLRLEDEKIKKSLGVK